MQRTGESEILATFRAVQGGCPFLNRFILLRDDDEGLRDRKITP